MKYLKTLVCILLFASASASYAQNCGPLTINSQADVDNFVAANAGSCNVLTNLTINFDADLSGLLFIQWISGTLKISNNVHLSSFQGLNNLQNIGTLDIDGSVTSFENLDFLRRIGELYIEGNSSNPPTINFIGLENVNTIEKMQLSGITITSFNSLQNLTNTSMTRLYIINCPGIQSIDVFNSLTEVTGILFIGGNPDLQAINGFTNLETISQQTNGSSGSISISSNPSLTSIVGFSSLSNVQYFSLQYNSALNDCCILLPFLYTSDPSDYLIFNNAPDCYNQNFIIDYCESFTDTDGDGVVDEFDNCLLSMNNNQSDVDNDGLGDACDDDIDGDGIPNLEDNCPDIPNNNQADANGDGIGDSCVTQSGTGTGSFGVGTNMPASKLHVSQGDVYIDNLYRGIIMKTPSGKCYRYKPDNNGMWVGKEIVCPN